MRIALAVCLAVAFAATAYADDKKPQKKPAPDLNTSPWSATVTDKNYGLTGTSRTVVKRDMGSGWSVGGQMTVPYQDQRIGGSGAPGFNFESPTRGTTFGPYLHKQF